MGRCTSANNNIRKEAICWGGGILNNENEDDDEYEPTTAIGGIAKYIFGADDSTAAGLDLGSSGLNIGSDAIPVVGNAVGAAISLGDSIYNGIRFVRHPSWERAKDVGLSALGILPGLDAKNVADMAKATKQITKTVKETKKLSSAKKVLKKSKATKNRTNVYSVDASGKTKRIGSLDYIPKKRQIVGALGNIVDSMDDGIPAGVKLYQETMNMLENKQNKSK